MKQRTYTSVFGAKVQGRPIAILRCPFCEQGTSVYLWDFVQAGTQECRWCSATFHREGEISTIENDGTEDTTPQDYSGIRRDA